MFEDIEKKLNSKKDSEIPRNKENKHNEKKEPYSVDKEIKARNDLSSAAVKTAVPGHPVLKEFDGRIKKLRDKGKKRGKRYSIIGITASILIFIGVLAGGYFLFSEVVNITKEVEQNEEINDFSNIIDPQGRCAGDNCCLASLEKINKNKYIEPGNAGECETGYKENKLNCETSLVWCEREEIEDLNNIESVTEAQPSTSTTDWLTYRNEEYDYQLNYPPDWKLNLSQDDSVVIGYPDYRKEMPEGGRIVSIKISSSSLNDFIEDYNNSDIGDDGKAIANIINQEEMTVNGVKATKLTGTTAFGVNSHFIFIETSIINYVISYDDFDEYHNNIIATFQFINKTEKTENDFDKDGLSNEEEVKYNTDPINPDTDGDGYLDGDEVKNGFNPAGEGKLDSVNKEGIN